MPVNPANNLCDPMLCGKKTLLLGIYYWKEQVEIWFFIIAALVTSTFLLALVWNNAKHWRKFNRWKKTLLRKD